jgi:hypothetical protein
VSPLANLVSTAQVKLGDFIQIDLNPEGRMIFTKQVASTTNAAGWECFGDPADAHSLAARPAGYRIDSNLR